MYFGEELWKNILCNFPKFLAKFSLTLAFGPKWLILHDFCKPKNKKKPLQWGKKKTNLVVVK